MKCSVSITDVFTAVSGRDPASSLTHNHVVYKNMVGSSSMIGFPLVIADSEQSMQGNEPVCIK